MLMNSLARIDTDGFEMAARYVLWGYPELLAEFKDSVLPQLKVADAQLEAEESGALTA